MWQTVFVLLVACAVSRSDLVHVSSQLGDPDPCPAAAAPCQAEMPQETSEVLVACSPLATATTPCLQKMVDVGGAGVAGAVLGAGLGVVAQGARSAGSVVGSLIGSGRSLLDSGAGVGSAIVSSAADVLQAKIGAVRDTVGVGLDAGRLIAAVVADSAARRVETLGDLIRGKRSPQCLSCGRGIGGVGGAVGGVLGRRTGLGGGVVAGKVAGGVIGGRGYRGGGGIGGAVGGAVGGAGGILGRKKRHARHFGSGRGRFTKSADRGKSAPAPVPIKQAGEAKGAVPPVRAGRQRRGLIEHVLKRLNDDGIIARQEADTPPADAEGAPAQPPRKKPKHDDEEHWRQHEEHWKKFWEEFDKDDEDDDDWWDCDKGGKGPKGRDGGGNGGGGNGNGNGNGGGGEEADPEGGEELTTPAPVPIDPE